MSLWGKGKGFFFSLYMHKTNEKRKKAEKKLTVGFFSPGRRPHRTTWAAAKHVNDKSMK